MRYKRFSSLMLHIQSSSLNLGPKCISFAYISHYPSLWELRAASPGGDMSQPVARQNPLPHPPTEEKLGKPQRKTPQPGSQPGKYQDGHPSKYKPGPTLLNFRDLTRTGVSNVLYAAPVCVRETSVLV